MYAVLIFLGAMAALALWFFICWEFRRIAVMKGQSGTRYFLWCFFTGIFGMLMVIALPKGRVETGRAVRDELPDI